MMHVVCMRWKVRVAFVLTLVCAILCGTAQAATSAPLRVGTEISFPPYIDVDAQGRATGFAVELFAAAAQAAGLTATYHPDYWDIVWGKLKAGEIDALPLVARLPAREGQVEFTRPHTLGYDNFFTRQGHAPIATIEQARTLSIIVLRSDAAHQELAARGFNHQFKFVNDLADGFRLLASGQHVALLAPRLQGEMEIKKLGLTGVISHGPLLSEYRREFCFATKKGDTALRDRLDLGLSIVKANGEYDRLYRKWLDIYDPPTFPVKQVAIGAALAAALLGLLGLWTWSLRRQVTMRTRSLTAEIVAREAVEKELRSSKDGLERQVAERTAELAQAGENMRLFIKQAPISIAMFDCAMNYLAVSDRWIADFGRGHAELVGLNHYDIHPDLPDEWKKVHQLGLVGATIKNEEDLWLQADGSRHWSRWSVQPWMHPGGKIGGIIISSENITKRKLTEEALRASTLRQQAHIENSPLAVVSWDKDFFVTQWAGEAERMFGWTAAETVGKSIMELNMVYAEDFPLVQESMEKIKAAQRYVVSHNRNVTKDGRVIHCVWYNSILADKDGAMESVMSLVLDVSENIHVVQEMAALNIQLTHDVAKRTAELSALAAHIQNVSEKERANLARELHDEMGSILTCISMELGQLKKKTSDPERLQDLSVIKDLLSKATKLKQTVVSQLYPTSLDTYGLFASIERLVNEYSKHSGNTVELSLPKEEVVMEAAVALAAYRITQECLTNIAKHSEASKVHIEGRLSNGFLELVIHDNGKGMPGEISVNRRGIFGIKERASYLGGSMEIGSTEGGGTTARLRLPLAVAKAPAKKRVLVVDDHAIVRDAIRRLLDTQTDDFAVEGEAADGDTAVNLARDGTWDIMLLDISLPKKNGLKVLEEVIALKPELPIIMLSSHAKDQYAELALAKGAACYIEKGETDKLVEEMRRATMRNNQRDQ